MFSSCKQLDQYMLQMLPSETFEQLMAWVKYLPCFINITTNFFKYCKLVWRYLQGRSGPVSIVSSDDTTPQALQVLIQIGWTICNMEWGEDISYLTAAFLWLPFCQRNIFNSISSDSPSTTYILTCLLITIIFEHIVSVIGITLLRKLNIVVSHKNIPLLNDFNSVGASKTSKSLLFYLVCLLCTIVILVALGEA